MMDMIWLRTCHEEGTDAAFTALMRARPDETDTYVFQDTSRYNGGHGDGWRHTFTRLPQVLNPNNVSPVKSGRTFSLFCAVIDL